MSKEQNRRMAFKSITLIFSLIIFIFSSSQILTAQKKQASPKMDYTKAPTYGDVTLDNSFGAAPHSQTITSGGEVNSDYQAGCSGWVSEGPDFRLQWSGSTTQLAFFLIPMIPAMMQPFWLTHLMVHGYVMMM
jgi:hypothetical protein